MKNHFSAAGFRPKLSTGLYLLSVALVFTACHKHGNDDTPKELRDFKVVNLVADAGNAAQKDTLLKNAWGLAFSTTGTAWVNSEDGHVSAVYNSEGVTVRHAVFIPSPGARTGGHPTGIIFNGGSDFMLSNGQPARFIFVGVDGILSGWNQPAGDTALLIKNNSATSAYTGLTMAANDGNNYLYAADFRAGKIAVWDKSFALVNMSFNDPNIPSGYAPFNIQVVGTKLFVTYAKVGADGEDEPGVGKGYVSIFTTGGALVKRFASQGTLNAPWGIAKAPAGLLTDDDNDNEGHHNGNSGPGGGNDDHGKAGNGNNKDDASILVGNFGDGFINVFTEDGDFAGRLSSDRRIPIRIDGLWALSFPPTTATTIDLNRLYFTAGPNDEKNGLFGYITK